MLKYLIADGTQVISGTEVAWVAIAACASALVYTAKTVLSAAQTWRPGKKGNAEGCMQRGLCMEHSGLVAELHAVRESQMRIEDRLNQVLEDK